jgi:hypothetical protein
MAMNFAMANRPETPQIQDAIMQQSMIAGQLRAQRQAEKMMYGSAAGSLAKMAPAGAWGNLGNAMIGAETVAPAAAAATEVPTLAAGADAAASTIAANAAAEAGLASAAGGGAAAGGAGAGGMGAALGALGPMGWAALLAGALMMGT